MRAEVLAKSSVLVGGIDIDVWSLSITPTNGSERTELEREVEKIVRSNRTAQNQLSQVMKRVKAGLMMRTTSFMTAIK
jgi:hypothetical protein